MESRLRELEVLQRGGQAAPILAASLPVLDAEDVEDLDEAPDNEVEAAEEEILDQATAARSIDGYLGEEWWTDTGNGLVSNVYYWQSLEALQTLMQHPAHLKAKAAQAQWLNGYQVVIAQVLRTYGDNQLTGLLPTARLFTQGTAPH